MAYADRSQSGNRVVASIIVAVLLAALGYAFVTGLAYQYVKKVANKMQTFEVAPPPPPPPDVPPPPPPPEQPMAPPPVVAPPAIVQVPSPPVFIQTVTTPPPAVSLAPPAPPPPPPPPHVDKSAAARGNPAEWITTDDYPPSALRAGDEGTSSITWTIGTNGRVSNCRVTHSSGHRELDEAACRAITRRGRYKPALDQNGNPIEQTQSRNVVWRIPDSF